MSWKEARVADVVEGAPTEQEVFVFPPSFAQERLWFLEHLEPGTATYNVPSVFRVAGRLDPSALERSVNEIVRRHEALRTTFRAIDGTPVQVIAPVLHLPLSVRDLAGMPPEERDREALALVREEVRMPFDLARGPLLRYGLIRLDEEEHILVFTAHHIITEGGWSTQVLLRELSLLYSGLVTDVPAQLPELSVQFADYAVWQRETLTDEALAAQFGYWRARLADAPTRLDLPTDHPPPAMQSSRGDTESLLIDATLRDAVLDVCRAESGITAFMVLLAAWQTLLHRYSGQSDIVVGVPVAGRPSPETEALIGFFVNTLCLRTDLSGEPTFRELLRRVHEGTLGALAHQDAPFGKLVETLQPERTLSHAPLFQVMFAFQNVPRHELALAGLVVSPVHVTTGAAMFELTLFVRESDAGWHAEIEYNLDLFDAGTIRRMLGHLHTIIAHAAARPDQPLSTIPLLTDAELDTMRRWNDTASPYPRERRIETLFAERVSETPDACAVSCGRSRCTYAELDARANRLAHHLVRLGVRREDRIAICCERSIDMVAALLAVLRAGAAYVPLDPSHPADRIAFAIQDARARIVLTDGRSAGSVSIAGVHVVRLDDDGGALAVERADAPRIEGTATDLAYVIYTSGSTGRPKGVEITHASVVNLLFAVSSEIGIGPGDVLLAVTTLSFDIAGLELWLPLLFGARVEVAPKEVTSDGRLMSALIRRIGVTHMQATPATWRLLFEAGWRGEPRLRALCGGEALPWDLADELRRACARVWNVYGPTETTIWSALFEIASDDDSTMNGAAAAAPAPRAGRKTGVVPLGGPTANTRFYVLDTHRQLVPVGVPGELYIGGDGVGRGYIGRPELTEERFIPDPFSRESGWRADARIYRTGDLVRWRPDGTLEYLGRTDFQIKLRGFRIELGEIEAALRAHEAIEEAVVVAREERGPESRRLIAYVTSANGQVAHDALHAHLERHLPDYMLPGAFVVLTELPRTPNGKVDRRALPAPDAAAGATESVLPRDALELQLLSIWEAVLGVRGIGVRDNFFSLGGHSLLAVRLFARIHALCERDLPLAALFRAPTVERFAELLREEGWASSWSPLVALAAEGDAAPLFLMHAIGGNVLNYRDIARRLGPERPVYALQAAGLDGKEAPVRRVADLASRYIAEIRRVRPEGPFNLGGSSFGGVVAYEMARQLVATGEQVNAVLLFDSFPTVEDCADFVVPGVRTTLRSFSDRWRFHAHALSALPLEGKLSYVRSKARVAWSRTQGRITGRPHPAPANGNGHFAVGMREVKRANKHAFAAYRPASYGGPVTLFRSSDSEAKARTDPTLGWGRYLTGDFRIFEAPGNHRTMIMEPYVGTLAAQVRQCMQDGEAVGCAGAEDTQWSRTVTAYTP